MRAASSLRTITVLLAAGLAAVGCQIVIGISGLEASGTGGAGGVGGLQCKVAADCGANIDCRTFACEEGTCVTRDAALGATCDDDSGALCDGKGTCVPMSCMDGVKNQNETDVDCGGSCSGCADGKDCLVHKDCQSKLCDTGGAGGGSTPGTCTPRKAEGTGCTQDVECTSGYCTDGVCCKVDACGECQSCSVSGKEGACQVTVDAACGDQTDDACRDPDTCDAAGVCQKNHAPIDTPCGDPAADACTQPDACDGAGVCQPRNRPAGTACGDPTDSACTAADTCDGNGVCLGNNAPSGTQCGGTCVAGMYTPPGTCGGGKCSAGPATSCGSYACNQAGTACNSTCSMGSGCGVNAVCTVAGTCEACGWSPMAAPCSGCESCDGSVCATICDTQGECTTSRNIDTMMRPARLECRDQCNNVTINCMGGAPCEVVCESGGCNNLKLNCSPDGACKLTCNGSSCTGAAITCGGNTCSAACGSPILINQACGKSCSCTKPGCL